MKGIKNGSIWLDGKWWNGYVIIFDEKIQQLCPSDRAVDDGTEWIDAQGGKIVPGFIDVHIHGYKGTDVMDGTKEALENIQKGLVENGVTSFLATTMTMHEEAITKALEQVKVVMSEKNTFGAEILGVHLEGPFINHAYKGAQSEAYIIPPKESLLETYKEIIKVVTIAPEIQGAMETIKKYHKAFRFSIGHSGASYEVASEAFENGAKSATHLFNAMTGLHHRSPGIVGATLINDCFCELIADKIHVHPALFKLVTKAKGLERLLLITDCMQGGGLGEGEYDLGGQMVTVANGKCTLPSGTIAGSVLKLNQGLRNFSEFGEYPLETVLPLVTTNPANYLGINHRKGSLAVGMDADIVIIDETVKIHQTIVKGKCVYESKI